jgi:dynein heavy chain
MCVEFTRINGKFPCAGGSPFLVNHMIRLIDCYVIPYKPKHLDEEEEAVPADMKEKLFNALIYAAVWGIGGVLDETCRNKYNAFLIDLISGEECIEKYSLDMGPDAADKYKPVKIPNKLPGEYTSLFDLYFDSEEMRWTAFTSTVPAYKINKDDPYLKLSIPTIDSIRMNNLAETILKVNKHILLVGPTGTGKSLQINKLLKEKFDNDDWAYY